jgi:chemotaxis protein MotB
MSLDDSSSLNGSGENSFLIYWGDILSLLLVFFIFFASMSDKKANMENVNATMKDVKNLKVDIEKDFLIQFQKLTSTLVTVEKEINDYIHQNHLENVVSIDRSIDSLNFTLQNSLLFTSGDDMLKEKSFGVLAALSGTLKRTNGSIFIEGHTDNLPINNDRFKSNWALSASRAISVVSFFENKGVDSKRFTIIGKNSHQPLVKNDTWYNRSKNRRVTIKVMAD